MKKHEGKKDDISNTFYPCCMYLDFILNIVLLLFLHKAKPGKPSMLKNPETGTLTHPCSFTTCSGACHSAAWLSKLSGVGRQVGKEHLRRDPKLLPGQMGYIIPSMCSGSALLVRRAWNTPT
uniref:Uncharacterized protein n=1 Tax=Amphilophus citrinellus TaxID=61819 RepID=A0A3Q0SZ09_AMPCI